MTINEYEREGGFHDELRLVRQIGLCITELEPYVTARPHRLPETDSIKKLSAALETVRTEIVRTRAQAS